MELVKGRPITNEGREAKEIRVYDFLDKLGIEYERIDHEPLMTMEACAEVDKIVNAAICKNLFLCNHQKSAFYLLMMPGDKKFKTKELSAQINSSRLSFAGGEEMEQMLDIIPGSLSVMGLMNDADGKVRLLIDNDLLKNDHIGCHPCVNTSSLRIQVKDLLDIYLPAVHHEPTFVNLVGED